MKKIILLLLLSLSISRLDANVPVKNIGKPSMLSKKEVRTQKRQIRKKARFERKLNKLKQFFIKQKSKLSLLGFLEIFLFFALFSGAILLTIFATGGWQIAGIIILSIFVLPFLYLLLFWRQKSPPVPIQE